MNPRPVLRVLGFLLVATGAGMLPAAAIAIFDGSHDLVPLLLSAGISAAVGVLLMLTTRGRTDLGVRDGFAIVTFAWLGCGLFGSLPYLLSGTCSTPVDAVFESVSGFTTTGATILPDVEAIPRGILFWRSLTQWLGGMGIVVLSVAVLPALGVGGMEMFRAEVPGPVTDRLSPRIQSTAKILWGVYVGISLVEFGLLMMGGMGIFDAACHTFTTVATGGFSTRNASLAAFDSAFLDAVVTFFMFVAGANFALHYLLVRRSVRQYRRDEEFRFYVTVSLISIVILWIVLVASGGHGILSGLRYASFQAVSIVTTTGFGTADYIAWGYLAQLVLFLLMFFGGCTGSTGGGMKHMRILVLGKNAHREMRLLIHRQALFNVKLSGRRVGDSVMLNILGFFVLYILAFVVGTLVVAGLGVGIVTSMGATAACLGNIGPGLGAVGPTSTYAGLPAAAKIVLTLLMILGRLELYTVLVLLTPMYWRRT